MFHGYMAYRFPDYSTSRRRLSTANEKKTSGDCNKISPAPLCTLPKFCPPGLIPQGRHANMPVITPTPPGPNRPPAALRYCADTWQISACHCEPVTGTPQRGTLCGERSPKGALLPRWPLAGGEYGVLATVLAYLSFACHCEPVRTLAWQSVLPAVKLGNLVLLWANP